MRTFTTTDKPQAPPVSFVLDGRQMVFRAPGWAPMLYLAQDLLASQGEAKQDPTKMLDALRGFMDWLGAGLSDKDGEWILGRLKDPEDPFDLEDVVLLMEGLMEELTNRPTLPSSDSKPSQPPTDSTGGRHTEASIPQSLTSDDFATSSTST